MLKSYKKDNSEIKYQKKNEKNETENENENG